MRRGLITSRTPPEWNIRVLTEDDLYQYTDEAGIIIREAQIEDPGFSMMCDGKLHIILNDELRGAERLFVGFHELAHYWLHPPGVQMFYGLARQIELEADIVAACAMIPKTLLPHYWPSEIVELYGYSHGLVRFRCEVFDKWKI